MQCQNCILGSASCYVNVREFNLFCALMIAQTKYSLFYELKWS